jgi:hypothetical protein
MVAYGCHSNYTGGINRRITVLDVNAPDKIKSKKGLGMWVKWY